MTGGLPGNVAKGRVLEGLARLLCGLSTPQLADLYADLDSSQVLLPLVDEHPYDPARPRCIVEKHGLPGAYPPPHPHLAWSDDKPRIHRRWFPAEGPPGSLLHGGWWESHQPLEEVVRAGLRMAIERLAALRPRPPVDCYWVSGGEQFELAVLETKDHGQDPAVTRVLTLLFRTPPPPISGRAGDPSAPREDIWVSKHVEVAPGEQVVSEDPGRRWVTTRLGRFPPAPGDSA